MEDIKKWLDENGIQYTYAERGKNKYIDVIAGKDGKLVTVRKGTYNVYTLLEKNESGTVNAVLESSRKLEKIMETLIKRFKIDVASKEVLKWQLPIKERLVKGLPDYVHPLTKAHFFVNHVSLCGKYIQHTGFYETDIENGEVTRRPEIACKKCYKKWLKEYNKTS